MARIEENMAEGTPPGPGVEGQRLYIANSSGAVVDSRPIGPQRPTRPVSDVDTMAEALARVLGRQGEAGRTARIERSQTPGSRFKDIVTELKTLEQQPPENRNEARIEELRVERDKLRHEANRFGWFNLVKEDLFEFYYDSRVKVDRDQKLGTDEWKRRTNGAPGRLEVLRTREEAARVDSWEANWLDQDHNNRRGFWDSAQVQAAIDRLASEGVTSTKQQLMDIYGGIIDDFQEESLKMIRAVVVDRHMFNRQGGGIDRVREKYHLISDDYYHNNGLSGTDANGDGLWDFVWTAEGTGRTEYLKNFDDIRDIVEHERRKGYFIPNLGDYESYIKLVADDIGEVEEDIPYILSFFKYKFGTGEPKKIQEGYDEETRKLHKALEKFGLDLRFEREKPEFREFRRLLSKIDQHLKLLQTYEFSNLAYLDWQPYLQSGGDLARGFHDTEYQDSIPDSILLDKDGLMMLALSEFEKNDGEYWRYGSNNADTPKYMKEGDAREWQERRKEEMKETLMRKQLKSMDNLLGLTLDKDRHITDYGAPQHPAFQRLKAKLAALDEKDIKEGKPLVDAYGKEMTRWQEYCEKAMAWQDNRTITEEIIVRGRDGRDIKVIRRVLPIGDVRDYKQRVLFQHPLARALSEEEAALMYDDINPNSSEFRKYRVEKERKVNSIIGFSVDSVGSAERIARAFQEDAAAGLARHLVSFAQMRAIGLIPEGTALDAGGQLIVALDEENYPIDANRQRIPRELLHYAVDKDGKSILENGKLIPEAIPHKVLLKHLCQLAMRQDWQDVDNDPAKQRTMQFKLSYVMQKMGIPRGLPLFSNWYLGAHDSKRPDWLADIEQALPGFKELMADKRKVRNLDPDDEFGGDEKTVLTRAVEDEREFVEVMEMYIRDQFPSYFNFPGHDVRGGGNKEARNLFLLPYGQSRGTVEMNGLIPHIWLGETDFLSAYGCSNWREFIGIYKLSDEVNYKTQGSLFETPRDAEYWFRRVGAIIEQQKLWISGSDKGPAVLNGGWGSGFFLWRALNRRASLWNVESNNILKGTDVVVNNYTTITNPEEAYKNLDEATYESYVKLAYQFVTPLVSIFEARQKLENVYGRSPGTAKFLNTLTWYAVSRWMDTNYEEFRGKYGNAIDVNLHMARKFIHTALYESKLIFSDEQFDQRMVGYVIPKAEWARIKGTDWSSMRDDEKTPHKPIIKVISYELDSQGRTIASDKVEDPRTGKVIFQKGDIVEGEVVKGILDAFPPALRKKILERHNNPGAPIIFMGVKSEYPEELGIIKQLKKFREHEGMRSIYETLIHRDKIEKYIKRRTPVKRPSASETNEASNHQQNLPIPFTL